MPNGSFRNYEIMCSAIDNFKEKLNGLMSTLQDLSSAEQEAALSLLSSTLSSELGVLPNQTTIEEDIVDAQSSANSCGEASNYSLDNIKQKVVDNTFTEIRCGTTPDIYHNSTNAVQIAKERPCALKLGEYWLEEGILSAKPVGEQLQCENLPVLGVQKTDLFSSTEPHWACQIPHCKSSEINLLCNNKTSSSFRRHDIQHRRAKYPQSGPVLLPQQKEIISRSQTSSPPQEVYLSFQETQVSSQKEGPPFKKVCLLSHNRAGRKQSELPVFQQDEVPQKSASAKPRSSFQAVSTRREVDKLSSLSFTEAGLSSEEIFIPSGESSVPSGQNRLDKEKNDLAKPTDICCPCEKNMQKEQINDCPHQQTQVSLLPVFSSQNETILTHDQTVKIPQQINESFPKDKYLQQQDKVSLRTNETLQSSLFQQPQASNNGDATCPDQSHQDGRVPEEENISQDQVHLPQTEEYSTSSAKRISQSKDGSLMSRRGDNSEQLSCMRRLQDVQHQRGLFLPDNDLDDASLIVDECSVSSVDVVSISNAPPWDQDKLSMTPDLREATENLEKSFSRLKKQQELHFRQQQLRFGEHYVFSNEHSSELELLNKKLLQESHDEPAPFDSIRSHTIFHPCYSQRACNVLDQNLLILELTQNARCDAFSFNDVTTASSIDLPNDISEVLDYSLPSRSDRILDMNLPTDLTVVQDYPSKPLNSEVSGKVISSFTEAFSDTTPEEGMTGEDAALPTDLSVSTKLRKRRSEINDDPTQRVSDKIRNVVGCCSKTETHNLCCDNKEVAGHSQLTDSIEESLNSLANSTPATKFSDILLKKVTDVCCQKFSTNYITKNMRKDDIVRSRSYRKCVRRKNRQHVSVEQAARECSKLGSDDEEELDSFHGNVAESCSAAVDVVYDLSLSNVDLFEKSKKEVVKIHGCSSWNSSLMSNVSSNPGHIYHLDEPTFSAVGVAANEDITSQTMVDSTINRTGGLWDSAKTYPEDLTISSGDALNLSPRYLLSPPLQSCSSTGTSSGHSSLIQASVQLSLESSLPRLGYSNAAPNAKPPPLLTVALGSSASTPHLRWTSRLTCPSDSKTMQVDLSELKVACDVSDKFDLRADDANASQSSLCEASCNSPSRLLHSESKPLNPDLSFSEESKLTCKISVINDSQNASSASIISTKCLESNCKSLKPSICKRVNKQAITAVHSRKQRPQKSNKSRLKSLKSNVDLTLKKRTSKKIGQDIGGLAERKNGRYHCSYCGLKFLHKVSFVKHTRGHSANSCSMCPSNFSSRRALRHHCRLVHSLSIAVTSYSCDTCPRTFSKRPLLYAHQAKHHTAPEQHRCGKCGSLLPSLIVLSQHLKQHSNAELPCSLCDATFSRRQQLLHHLQGHERNKCPLCESPCSSRKQLLQHTKTAHAPCALCTGHEASSSTACCLANPVLITAGSSPDITLPSTCGKVATEDCAPISTKLGYSSGGNPPAPCPSVGCRGLSLSLRAPVHACSRCPRVFPRPCLLRDHQAFHDGVGAVRCDSCDKTFASRRGFRKHFASRQHILTSGVEGETPTGKKQAAILGGSGDCKTKTSVVVERVHCRAGVYGTGDNLEDGDIKHDNVHTNAKKEGNERPARSVSSDNLFVSSDGLSEADPAMSNQSCTKEAKTKDNKKSKIRYSSKCTKFVQRKLKGSRKGIATDLSANKSPAGTVGERIKMTVDKKSLAFPNGCMTSSCTEGVDNVANKNVINSVAEAKFGMCKAAKPRGINTRLTKKLRKAASERSGIIQRPKTADFSFVPKVKTPSLKGNKENMTSSLNGEENYAVEKGLNLSNDCAAPPMPNDRRGGEDVFGVPSNNVCVQNDLDVTKRQPPLGKGNKKIVINTENYGSLSSCVKRSSNCATENCLEPVPDKEIRSGKSSTLTVGGSCNATPHSAVSSTERSYDHGTASRADVQDDTLDTYERCISSTSGTASSDCKRGATATQERSPASVGAASSNANAVTIICSDTRTDTNGFFCGLVPSSSVGTVNTLTYEQPCTTLGNALDGAAKVLKTVSSTPHPPVKISQPCFVNRCSAYYDGVGCNATDVKNGSDLSYSIIEAVTSETNYSDACSVDHETQLSKQFPPGNTYTDSINHSGIETVPDVQLSSSYEDQFSSEGVFRNMDDTSTPRHSVLRRSSLSTCVSPTSSVISGVPSTPLPVNDGLSSCTRSIHPPLNGCLPSCTLSLSSPQLLSDPQSLISSTSHIKDTLPSCPPSSVEDLSAEISTPSRPKLQCAYCDYSTQRKFSLDRHIDTHFNRRRFVCKTCEKAFQSLLNLKEHHAFLHSSLRNFKCDKCTQTFKNKSTLVRHVRQKHGNTKPYACHCGICFKRFTHLKRHMLVVHNESTKLQKRTKIIFLTDSIKPIGKESTLVQSSSDAS